MDDGGEDDRGIRGVVAVIVFVGDVMNCVTGGVGDDREGEEALTELYDASRTANAAAMQINVDRVIDEDDGEGGRDET